MVVKKARLDMEVKVDDSELERVTAGIGSTMETLQRKALGVANVLAEIGKTKAAITNLAALTKEGTNAAGVLADMNAQLLAITKNEKDAQRAFTSIKRMMEYKPPTGAGGTRPPGTMPDYVKPGTGGRRMAGIHPSVLPIVAAAFSPSVIGAVLNRYDPLLRDAADRYFLKDVDPRLNEYLLGTTPGGMYGMTRAGIDRARGGYKKPPPRPEPTESPAWRAMKGWTGAPIHGYPDIYYDSDVFRRQRDQQQQDPWGKHEFWAQKRYKRWREEPYGAGQRRRIGTQDRPAELRIPQTEAYEFVKGSRFGMGDRAGGGRTEETEEAQLESLEVIEAEKEKNHERELERIEEMAESFASYVDPAPYIVEGLKSGDMRQAIEDFAVAFGTRVAEELVHKLIVMGIMAILSVLTGGGSQLATMGMRRGGVLKAAKGLVGTFPPRPGGYTIPFGNKMVNFAEAGTPEVAAFLPPGRAGQDIVLNKLMPMFNIKPQVETHVETRPQNNITVQVTHADRHHIQAHNAATAGKVNKAVTVRK